MRIYSFLITLLFFHLTTMAQLAMGKWRTHLAYNNTTMIAKTDNKVFAVSDGVLYSVSVDENAVKVMDKTVGLSDSNVGNIAYDSTNKLLLVTYKNGNIDILSDKGIKNIPDLLNKSMIADKNINHISFSKNKVYLSCNFGIVVLNSSKGEIADTYYIGPNGTETVVLYTIEVNNTIYALTNNTIYYASASNPNLVDFSQWKTVQNIPGNGSLTKLIAFNNELILLRAGKMYAFSGTAWQSILPSYSAVNMFTTENKLVVYNSPTDLHLFDKDFGNTSITNAGEVAGIEIDNESGNLWLAGGAKGVVQYSVTNQSALNTFKPNGPAVNSPWNMKFAGEKLYVLPGGRWSSQNFKKGEIMIYQNNSWTKINTDSIELVTGHKMYDLMDIAFDPKDNSHFFVTSYGTGLYEFKNNVFTKWYTPFNSNLESVIPAEPYFYTRLDAVAFDNMGNLHVTNGHTSKFDKILKPDGSWTFLQYPSSNNPTFGTFLISNVNQNQKWINSVRYTPGLLVFDDNGTPTDNNDDTKSVFLSSFTDADNPGAKINPTTYYCMVQDHDGVVWAGTEQGPLLFYNTERVFDSGYTCSRIKIPRNNGTGLADYLLQTDKIKAMAIDGANRKWIGTETSGVFLMSENGQTTIKHFTADNSPLISNDILSIAINPISGEVFFGTSNGIVSYQSDAANAGESFGNVRAYPNPVRENYSGEISITGLVVGTQVKITDLNGNLIYQTVSNGSIATWNGKRVGGKKVSSGVYLVLCVNQDGTQSIATKILVVN